MHFPIDMVALRALKWLTRDPIAEAGGINIYGYVGGNPANWIDPLGLVDISYLKVFTVQGKGAAKTNKPDAFTVAAHGTPNSLAKKSGARLSPEALVKDIMSHPKYSPGMPVYIYACNAGNTEGASGGEPFAQKVADLLPNSSVYAPDSFGWFSENGFAGIYDKSNGTNEPDYSKPGSWVKYERQSEQ
ncbi:RHS repeat-associated core domain-containing protein [Microbulbifer thermotolerans]|nr:RHS repeat-associated core domain-containing protein [Microbulbifer thermotolerans]